MTEAASSPIASGKGGVGKTWFAITLAHALARQGRACCCSTPISAWPMSTSSSA